MKEDLEKVEMFTCSSKFEVIHNQVKNSAGEVSDEKTYRITALVGDRFMNGGFFPESESKRVYKNWEGTLHDINHMGTSAPDGNILYFVGYHTNIKHNSATKEVTMDVKVNHNTMYAKAWEAYIETCELAGQIPNVSTTYLGNRKLVMAKNLPAGVDYKSEGYSTNDFVPVLANVVPFCVSTVLVGKCNDKDGCGVRNTSCPDGSCNLNDEQDITNALKEKRQEIIKRIQKKEEKLND